MPRPHTKSATLRRPISAKRKKQNRESQRTFRKKKKLQALQRTTPETKSATEHAFKEWSASRVHLSREENIATATIAPSVPDILQTITCQDEPTSLLVSSPPNSNVRYQSEQPIGSRVKIAPAVFMPVPTAINLQHPSDGPLDNTGNWKAGLESQLDETIAMNYAADFSTLSSSSDYNNVNEAWSFSSAQPAGLFFTQPFRESTTVSVLSGDGVTTASLSTVTPREDQRTLHDELLRSVSSWHATPWESPPSTSEFAENTLPGATKQRASADHTGTLDMLQLLRINRSEENKTLLQRALAQDHSLGEIFLAGLRVLGCPLQSTQSNALPALPDLRSIFLWKKLIGSNSLSPFYRPEAKITEALQSIMDIIPDTLPRDLKPTLPQVSHEHSPFLDLLPFPTLRARAIMFATCTPLIIDLVELKNDIINGGLICWNGSRKGSRQPWDMRSWEAAPWFLDKWKVLVGGTNDETWSQTMWSKQLREDHSSARL